MAAENTIGNGFYGSNPAVVNNFSLDPLSGYDFEVYVQNQGSAGEINDTEGFLWIGKFQSLTLSIRNATETYLELGQRIPRYLDGEIQIAWVLEQGLVDGNFLHATFGYPNISREQLIGRMPRFQITFDANAPVLNASEADSALSNQNFTWSSKQKDLKRNAAFQYHITHCKVDNYSMGMMPGRRVVAQRWEGVAEGIKWVKDRSVQDFKLNTEGGFYFPNTGPSTV